MLRIDVIRKRISSAMTIQHIFILFLLLFPTPRIIPIVGLYLVIEDISYLYVHIGFGVSSPPLSIVFKVLVIVIVNIYHIDSLCRGNVLIFYSTTLRYRTLVCYLKNRQTPFYTPQLYVK